MEERDNNITSIADNNCDPTIINNTKNQKIDNTINAYPFPLSFPKLGIKTISLISNVNNKSKLDTIKANEERIILIIYITLCFFIN